MNIDVPLRELGAIDTTALREAILAQEIELGRLDEAVSSYQKAVSIKPDFVESQHILDSLLGKTTRQPPG